MVHGVALLLQLSCPAQLPRSPYSEFRGPWGDPATALVLDPFAGNRIDWSQLRTEPRVVGIVHKATEGLRFSDRKYLARRDSARARGYLWGSYHFGLRGDPVAQADHYLDTAKPSTDEVIALDLDDPAKYMSIEEAAMFIRRVRSKLGRIPLIYASKSVAMMLAGSSEKGLFAQAGLWYVRNRAALTEFPIGPWKSYRLWQFSSELGCQIRIPGIDSDMDVDVFWGSPTQLRSAWPF